MKPLRFITCGSVDDGKSTLIGRILMDTKVALSDQVDGVSKNGKLDLSLFTDGLAAEREQGITIDVAYRYLTTTKRKFIVADSPGHVQYTRNMVTAASLADVAVLIVDASKLDLGSAHCDLLEQTVRHFALVSMLKVPGVIVAVNKLDLQESPGEAYAKITSSLALLADILGYSGSYSVIPVSALHGYNVVHSYPAWSFYSGPTLINLLEESSNVEYPGGGSSAVMSIQFVEKIDQSFGNSHSRRIAWGRPSLGTFSVGTSVRVGPQLSQSSIYSIIDYRRNPISNSLQDETVGIILEDELDLSRGSYLYSGQVELTDEISVEVSWFSPNVSLTQGSKFSLMHGRATLKAMVASVPRKLNLSNLDSTEVSRLVMNDLGSVRLKLSHPLPVSPYGTSRSLGSVVFVDSSTRETLGTGLIK